MIAGPGDASAAAEGRGDGRLRAAHADREQVIGTLKAAFVHGRLTEDELGARAGQVYASRTYAELADVTSVVTADLPVEPTVARPSRDPWRATKIAGQAFAFYRAIRIRPICHSSVGRRIRRGAPIRQ